MIYTTTEEAKQIINSFDWLVLNSSDQTIQDALKILCLKYKVVGK